MSRRRLAWQRSWFFVTMGVFALGAVVVYCMEVGVRGLQSGDFILPLLALPVIALVIRRGLTGSRSKRQLWVDVPAGKLIFVDGGERPFDELGTLSIEKRYQPRTQNTMPMYAYELRASGFERPIFWSLFEGETKRRYEALDNAMLQSALRRLLERPQGEGAFRESPDLAREALACAGTPERAVTGLKALARDDHDRGIRDEAAKLAAALESREQLKRAS